VKLIPDNRLLLETDAPYLLPRNIQPRPSSRINEPAYLPHILENVAFHQGKTVELLARQSLQNSRTFFDL
jgi:TatD DNase family protein